MAGAGACATRWWNIDYLEFSSLTGRMHMTQSQADFLRGRADLDDMIARLRAYEAAGADVRFAPGRPALDAVRTVCVALTKPFN